MGTGRRGGDAELRPTPTVWQLRIGRPPEERGVPAPHQPPQPRAPGPGKGVNIWLLEPEGLLSREMEGQTRESQAS